jgi:hypothetical protein
MMVHQKLPCELLVRLLLRPGRLHHSCCAATYYSPPPCRSKEYGKAKKQCITVYHASRKKGLSACRLGRGRWPAWRLQSIQQEEELWYWILTMMPLKLPRELLTRLLLHPGCLHDRWCQLCHCHILPPSLPAMLPASCGTPDLYGRAASDDAVSRRRVEADGVGGERGRG